MSRIFCLIGFSYFISLFLSSFIPESVLIYAFGGIFVAFILSCFISKFRKDKIIPISLFICSIAILVNFFNFNNYISQIQKLDNTDKSISGKIIELPYKKHNRYNYTLKIENIDGEKIKPFKTKISSSEPLEADVYDTFTGKVHFYLPENNPNFDSKAYYRSKNIHILAFAYNYAPYDIKIFDNSNDINYSILKLRKKLLSLPKYILSNHIADIINGFLLGEKHNFPEDIKNNFDRAGVYHLIATSGIHISILSQFLRWLLKKLKFGLRSSSILVSIGILFFMALTGFSPSVMRAGIVTIIYNLGFLVFRRADSLNSLGLAVFLICLFSPTSATNIGLCLSVFSSLGIILFEKEINLYISKKISINNKVFSYFISILSVSISVLIFTTPIVMWFYKKLSLISLISNLILIPISTVLLTSTLLLQFFMLINATNILVMPIAFICGITTRLIDSISALLAKIPFAMIYLDYGFIKLCIAFSLVLFAISVLSDDFKKSIKLSLLLSVSIFIIGTISYIVFTYNLTRIAVINSGDGLSLVISKNFKKAIIISPSKKFNDLNLNAHLLKLSDYKSEYLSIYSNELSELSLINDFIKNYNSHVIFIPDLLEDEVELDIPKNSKAYYGDNTSFEIWKNLKVENINLYEHTFLMIEINKLKILVCCDGGNAENLPEKYKYCDFLIVNKLPINYECIQAQKIIISNNKENSEIMLSKLLAQQRSVFSTTHNGNIYIDVNNENKFKIRGFQ